MQLISAVVPITKVDDISEALQSFGFRGLTITEVSGFGRRRGPLQIYRGAKFRSSFNQKAKIEIVAKDEDVPDMIDLICKVSENGHGRVDTGKIWVVPVSEIVRMRTKETGADAL